MGVRTWGATIERVFVILELAEGGGREEEKRTEKGHTAKSNEKFINLRNDTDKNKILDA